MNEWMDGWMENNICGECMEKMCVCVRFVFDLILTFSSLLVENIKRKKKSFFFRRKNNSNQKGGGWKKKKKKEKRGGKKKTA